MLVGSVRLTDLGQDFHTQSQPPTAPGGVWLRWGEYPWPPPAHWLPQSSGLDQVIHQNEAKQQREFSLSPEKKIFSHMVEKWPYDAPQQLLSPLKMLLFIFFLLVKRNIVRDQCAAFLICLLAEYLGINADTWSVVHMEKNDYINKNNSIF